MSPTASNLSAWRLLAFVVVACAASFASAAQQWLTFEGKDGPGKGKHIVLISGDEEYRSEEGLPQLAKILANHHGFTCTVLFSLDPKTGIINPDLHTNIPNMQAIQNADLVIMLTRFRSPPPGQMKYFVDYINSGKPIIGLRTATHGFEFPKNSEFAKYSWNSKVPGWQGGFGRRILGETWVNHWGQHAVQSTRGIIAPGMENSPLVRGVHDLWVPTDVYEVHLPDTCTPLILGEVLKGMNPSDPPIKGRKNEPLMPIAWTKTYKGENGTEGRVFASTMGAATDLLNEDLRRLIVNATYWCLGMEVPPKANVGLVGDYHPTMFGFGKFQKGKTPDDYAGE